MVNPLKGQLRSLGIVMAGLLIIVVPVFALASTDTEMETKEVNNATELKMPSLGREVSISNAGGVLVRNAKVISVSNGIIVASTKWGEGGLIWTVKTGTYTNFSGKDSENSTFADVAVGNFISFSGALDQTTNALTARADVVKNWSLGGDHAKFEGTVVTINANTKSFRLASTHNGEVTIKTSGDTTYGEQIKSFSDIGTNTSVTVKGSYNPDSRILAADTIGTEAAPPEVKKTEQSNWLALLSTYFGFGNQDK